MRNLINFIQNEKIIRVAKFGIVGVLGFITDAGFFFLLKIWVNIYTAKLFSFMVAVIVTWLINRFFTFKYVDKNKKIHVEFLLYLLVSILGGGINYMAFYFSVNFSSTILKFPIIGVAFGSLCGMVFNYTSTRLFVFK